MNRISLPAFLLLLLSPSAVFADSGYSPEVKMMAPGLQWNPMAGQYRFAMHHTGSFVLDRDGTPGPMRDWGEHRVRWSPAFSWGRVGLKVEMDVVSGQLFGDHEDFSPDSRRLERRDADHGAGFDGLHLREAYAQVLTPVGLIRVGQMTSRYGLGILANSGADDDSRFGVRRYGDIVDRALLALKPFAPLTGRNRWGDYLTIVLAGDLVYRDENAIWADGDRAYMGNAGLFYRHPAFANGLVFTYRTQEDSDGDELEAFVLNVNGSNRFSLAGTEEAGDLLALTLGYEIVGLMGHTDRFQQLGSPEGLDLESLGGVGRLGLEVASLGLEVELEVGYASGDGDPYDDESHAFFFDPDYNVGLIFFDEMLPLITARSVEISSDPVNMETPPKGLDLIPSQERVTNSLYYFPQVRYNFSPASPFLEKVGVLVGALILTTPSDFAHSYYTFENGGVAANHQGRPTDSSYLGTELLAGFRVKSWPWSDHVGLSLNLDQSHVLPGQALADVDGNTPDPVWKVLGAAALEWR